MSKLKFAAGVLVVLALAAACSGADKKPAPGTSGAQASAVPPTSSSSSSESATGPVLKVLATQPTTDLFAFDTTGTETVSGGAVSITLTNGTTVAHELRLIRLRDGDFNSFKLAIGENGAAVVATLGDLAYASPTVAAGKSNTDTANLVAGSYALVCLLPAPDGTPYAQHGMLTRLNVTAAVESLPSGSGSSATSTSSGAGESGSSASSGSTAPSSSSSSSSSSSGN